MGKQKNRIPNNAPQPELPSVEVNAQEMQKKVGERIRELRVRCGATQPTLAAAYGSNPSTLCRIERGERELKLPEMLAIAKVLNVELSDLIGGN